MAEVLADFLKKGLSQIHHRFGAGGRVLGRPLRGTPDNFGKMFNLIM